MHRRCAITMTTAAWAIILGIGTTVSQGDEIWMARDGTLTLTVNRGALAERGVAVDGWVSSGAGDAATVRLVLGLDSNSVLQFAASEGGAIRLHGRDMRVTDGLVLGAGRFENTVLDFAVGREDWSPPLDEARSARRGPAYIELRGIKMGLDREREQFRLAARDVVVTPGLAAALGRPELAGMIIGSARLSMPAYWVGGTRVQFDTKGGSTPEAAIVGCDMTFCQMYNLAQYGREGSVVGLAFATTSWNVGDMDCIWLNNPDEEHPFIVMNLFREKNDRFEQIGQSWIKHGFYALGNTQCGGSCSYEPGHGPGDWLGQGCTDTYGSGLNASQSGMGPRYEVDPWTGDWLYVGSHSASGGASHDGIQHRMQVDDDDLDPALNAGASYFIEGYYVMLDDVNVSNSAAWHPVGVSGSPGGSWSFSDPGSGVIPTPGFAIDAWTGATQITLAEQLPVVEFVSPDGRCLLSAKATDLGGGTWHYEYALLNVDMDRQVGAFTVPFPSGTIVSNVGSHATRHHDEPFNTKDADAVPIDNAAWTSSVSATDISWTTATNPLRWGTMYNFRFDADAAPGTVAVTLGMFRSGTPSTISGSSVGPFGPPPTCGDGVVEGSEECDPPDGLHCIGCLWVCGDGVIQSGEQCDPPNGTDCDSNCQTIYICGDGVTDPGEECDDAGESATCDADCTWATCGDTTVNTTAGESCDDGGESATCDADCTPVVCGDGTLNATALEQCDDGNTIPGDGCDANCQIESDDDCADALVIGDGLTPFSTLQAITDGPAHAACQFDGITHNDTWFAYTPTCDGTLTVTTCEQLGGSADYDTALNVYVGCACPVSDANLLDCNDDDPANACGTSSGGYHSTVEVAVTAGTCYLLRVGGYSAANRGTGVLNVVNSGTPCAACGDGNLDAGEECDDGNTASFDGCDANCAIEGNAYRGGRLWDKWWVENGVAAPTGDHPLYPPAGPRSGSTTYRCKECHGWDYKGAAGAYGSGSHYTGIAGVFGSAMTFQEMFDVIKLSAGPNGHDFASYGLSDSDILDLASFLKTLVIDTDTYIDAGGLFIGDPVQGEINYTTSPPGLVDCSLCHGADGASIDFGTPSAPEWVGTIAHYNPWEMLHKSRLGQPGVPLMTRWLEDGGTNQGAADIGRHAQVSFAVDCLDASHCIDANLCSVDACIGQFCEHTPLDCSGATTNCAVGECDPTDGSCLANPSGFAGLECRSSAGDCDMAEFCDGVDSICPPDDCAPASTPCNNGDGVCDGGCVCTGSVLTCPGGTAAECADVDGDNATDDVCTWWACNSGACDGVAKVVPSDLGGAFGDCALDGFCNLADALHALTCFAGTSDCGTINIDAGGAFGDCAPDGFCNLADALHALTCFAGTNPCTCGPAPDGGRGPTFGGDASLRAVAGARSIDVGSEVQVRIFVDEPLDALYGYQLTTVVSGGRDGSLELVNIAVENRRDAVFADAANPFEAFNIENGQMLAGNFDGPVSTDAVGYLATFTYRASSDAVGTFVVDVAHGDVTQTLIVGAEQSEQIVVSGTTPAAIVVTAKSARSVR